MKRKYVFLGIIIFLATACTFLANPSIDVNVVEVRNLSVSHNVDKSGRPVDSTTKFPATTRKIYVSFYLQTSREVPIEILWYREDKLVFRQEGKHSTDWLYSWIAPEEKFKPGLYRVEIRSQSVLLLETEFIIEESQP